MEKRSARAPHQLISASCMMEALVATSDAGTPDNACDKALHIHVRIHILWAGYDACVCTENDE